MISEGRWDKDKHEKTWEMEDIAWKS